MTVVLIILGIIALLVFGPVLLRFTVGLIGVVVIGVFSILRGAYKIFKWANNPTDK